MRRWFTETIRGGTDAEALREAADRTLAENFVDHDGLDPGHSKHALLRVLPQLLRAFPDLKFTVEHLIGEGDMVAVRLRSEATHTGEAMGKPPTGKRIVWTENEIYRLENGLVVESWGEAEPWMKLSPRPDWASAAAGPDRGPLTDSATRASNGTGLPAATLRGPSTNNLEARDCAGQVRARRAAKEPVVAALYSVARTHPSLSMGLHRRVEYVPADAPAVRVLLQHVQLPKFPSNLQRLCGARPADSARRVLEASLRPLPDAQVHCPPAYLVRELHIYNTDRAHQGRRTKGLTPEQALTDRTQWL